MKVLQKKEIHAQDFSFILKFILYFDKFSGDDNKKLQIYIEGKIPLYILTIVANIFEFVWV